MITIKLPRPDFNKDPMALERQEQLQWLRENIPEWRSRIDHDLYIATNLRLTKEEAILFKLKFGL